MSDEMPEGFVVLRSALEYFMESPVVTAGGELELPASEAEQVGAMVSELSECWDGFDGAIAGMYLAVTAAEHYIVGMAHEGCDECGMVAEELAGFLTVITQFPRALVEYGMAGLTGAEEKTARELIEGLGLEAPEEEE